MESLETEPGHESRRVAELLKNAAKPLSFAQLRSSSRLQDAKLKAALESSIALGLVFRWPDYRKSQFFWSQAPDLSAQEAVLALASEEALSRTALVKRACSRVQGFTRKDMERIVANLVASRDLQTVPAFTAGKLLIRSGAAESYVRAGRRFLENKFRKAGISPDLLFAPNQIATPDALAPQLVHSKSLQAQILDLIRSLEPITGVPVTTQKLRRRLPGSTKREFDVAALDLSKRHEVSLSLHHDPYNLSEADRELLIEGDDGNYYVAIAIRR